MRYNEKPSSSWEIYHGDDQEIEHKHQHLCWLCYASIYYKSIASEERLVVIYVVVMSDWGNVLLTKLILLVILEHINNIRYMKKSHNGRDTNREN